MNDLPTTDAKARAEGRVLDQARVKALAEKLRMTEDEVERRLETWGPFLTKAKALAEKLEMSEDEVVRRLEIRAQFLAKARALALNLGLLLGTVLLFGIIVEGTLRLSGYRFVLYPEDIEFGRPDPVLLKEAFLEDDDLFWVTRDYPEKLERLARERPPLILMGDSCTHLGHYDEALARRVETRYGQPLRYGNLGVAGWSSEQGKRQMLRDVLPLAPEVVTIYYGWNDHWIGFGIEDKTIAQLKRVFSSRWSDLRMVQLASQAAVAWGARSTAFPNRVSLPDFENNLRTMVESAKLAGITPMLITAASNHRPGQEPAHLGERWLRDVSELVPLHESYVQTVRKVADETHAALCDPHIRLSTNAPPDKLDTYFLEDGIHFTPEGDEILASILFKCLEREGLMDRLIDQKPPAEAPPSVHG